MAVQWIPEPVRQKPLLLYGPKVALILGAAWLLDRLIKLLLSTAKFPDVFSSNARALVSTVSRILLISFSILICLDTLGISITPILASLGVGSLAVALALQDTLNNFFSGVYILIDEPIRVGDYIRLQEGVEGHVKKIGWRSTHLLLATDSIVVVPNSKISAAIVTNYDLPDHAVTLVVPIVLSFHNDLPKIEKIALDVTNIMMKKNLGALAEAAPTVRFSSMNVANASNLELQISFRIRSFEETSLFRHELIKTLHTEFRKEGIEAFTVS
jgi:small-conductance mechanosensitive channel